VFLALSSQPSKGLDPAAFLLLSALGLSGTASLNGLGPSRARRICGLLLPLSAALRVLAPPPSAVAERLRLGGPPEKAALILGSGSARFLGAPRDSREQKKENAK
jgi:hypothetical protein